MFGITIRNRNISHANLAILNPDKKTMLRFEPQGALVNAFSYDSIGLQKELEKYFHNLLDLKHNELKSITPFERQQMIGLQTLEIAEIYKKNISDPNGYCGLWSYFSIFIYHHDKTKKKEKKGTCWLNTVRYSEFALKDIIRLFGSIITDYRDDELKNTLKLILINYYM